MSYLSGFVHSFIDQKAIGASWIVLRPQIGGPAWLSRPWGHCSWGCCCCCKSDIYLPWKKLKWQNTPIWKCVFLAIGHRLRSMYTQWRNKSKISWKLGRCGRQNMLWPYLKIGDWDLNFGRAVKAISSLGIRSPWLQGLVCSFEIRQSKINFILLIS